jgi:hypothetical protein
MVSLDRIRVGDQVCQTLACSPVAAQVVRNASNDRTILPAGRTFAIGLQNRQRFVTAKPFPHFVLDDFLPEWVRDKELGEFPDPVRSRGRSSSRRLR